MGKLVEHYAVLLNESTIAQITLAHAGNVFAAMLPAQDWRSEAGESSAIIVEIDGGMVPIVETDATR